MNHVKQSHGMQRLQRFLFDVYSFGVGADHSDASALEDEGIDTVRTHARTHIYTDTNTVF